MFWYYPTSNLLVNTFLRSLVVFGTLVLSGVSYYNAYWGTIVHDIFSLSLMPR